LLGECGYREVTSFISSPKTDEDQQACFVAIAPETVESGTDAPTDAPAPTEVMLAIGGEETLLSGLESGLADAGKKLVPCGEDLGEIAAAIDRTESAGEKVVAVIHALSLAHPRSD